MHSQTSTVSSRRQVGQVYDLSSEDESDDESDRPRNDIGNDAEQQACTDADQDLAELTKVVHFSLVSPRTVFSSQPPRIGGPRIAKVRSCMQTSL